MISPSIYFALGFIAGFIAGVFVILVIAEQWMDDNSNL